MKLITTLAFVLISISSMGQSLPYKTFLKLYYDSEFPLIYPHQQDILDKAIILDSREKEEYEVSHIHGARWIGYENFSIQKMADIPKNQPIVIYCSVGVRSQRVGLRLKEEGYKDVYNLYGGLFHWVNEGEPVYRAGIKTVKVHAFSPAWGIWLKKGEKVYKP